MIKMALEAAPGWKKGILAIGEYYSDPVLCHCASVAGAHAESLLLMLNNLCLGAGLTGCPTSVACRVLNTWLSVAEVNLTADPLTHIAGVEEIMTYDLSRFVRP
jgi:hypothetical protein